MIFLLYPQPHSPISTSIPLLLFLTYPLLYWWCYWQLEYFNLCAVFSWFESPYSWQSLKISRFVLKEYWYIATPANIWCHFRASIQYERLLPNSTHKKRFVEYMEPGTAELCYETMFENKPLDRIYICHISTYILFHQRRKLFFPVAALIFKQDSNSMEREREWGLNEIWDWKIGSSGICTTILSNTILFSSTSVLIHNSQIWCRHSPRSMPLWHIRKKYEKKKNSKVNRQQTKQNKIYIYISVLT